MKNAPASQSPKQPKVVFVSGRALDAVKFQERVASLQRLRTLPVAQRLGAAAIPFQSKPVLVDRSHWDESLWARRANPSSSAWARIGRYDRSR